MPRPRGSAVPGLWGEGGLCGWSRREGAIAMRLGVGVRWACRAQQAWRGSSHLQGVWGPRCLEERPSWPGPEQKGLGGPGLGWTQSTSELLHWVWTVAGAWCPYPFLVTPPSGWIGGCVATGDLRLLSFGASPLCGLERGGGRARRICLARSQGLKFPAMNFVFSRS